MYSARKFLPSSCPPPPTPSSRSSSPPSPPSLPSHTLAFGSRESSFFNKLMAPNLWSALNLSPHHASSLAHWESTHPHTWDPWRFLKALSRLRCSINPFSTADTWWSGKTNQLRAQAHPAQPFALFPSDLDVYCNCHKHCYITLLLLIIAVGNVVVFTTTYHRTGYSLSLVSCRRPPSGQQGTAGVG